MSNDLYADKNKFPWSVVVVVAAVAVFGCLIVGVFAFRALSQGAQVLPGGATGTPAAPAGSVAIDIASSNTKEDWMNAVVERFNSEQRKLASGKASFVRVSHVTSGGSQQAILDGKSQPVVWSPGDQSWVDGLNQV